MPASNPARYQVHKRMQGWICGPLLQTLAQNRSAGRQGISRVQVQGTVSPSRRCASRMQGKE